MRRGKLAALRGVGFAAAVLLGGVAVWLIVTGDTQKTLRIGALLGFWALLLGAYAVFGSRSPSHEPHPVAAAAPAPPTHEPRAELDVRRMGEIEQAALATARREFQLELRQLLRQEVTTGFAHEVSSLRAEVAALRHELVEKVGGQLRLERIETTRLIGSDLEALQQELRELRQQRRTAALDVPIAPTVEQPPAAKPGLARPNDIHDAEIVLERLDVPQRRADAGEPVRTAAAAQRPVGGDAARPAATPPLSRPAATARPATTAPSRPASPASSRPAAAAQPSRPTAAPTPPRPSTSPASRPTAAPTPPRPVTPAASRPTAAPTPPRPVTPPATSRPPAAASSRPAPAQPAASTPFAADPFASMPRITPFTDFALDPVPSTNESSSNGDASDNGAGRRHRADNGGNDVLARILARERD